MRLLQLWQILNGGKALYDLLWRRPDAMLHADGLILPPTRPPKSLHTLNYIPEKKKKKPEIKQTCWNVNSAWRRVYTVWAEPPQWASVPPCSGTTGRAVFLCAGPVERELGGPCRGFVLLLLILALNWNVMSGLLLYATSGLCARSTLQGDSAAQTPASLTTA